MKTKISKKAKVFTTALMIASTTIGSVAIAKTTTNEKAITTESCASCQLSSDDIISYLEANGYTNISVAPIRGMSRSTACDWIADTDYSYDTYIDCNASVIEGHEDLPE